MIVIGLALLWLVSVPVLAPAQSLKEIRVGSTDITVFKFLDLLRARSKVFRSRRV